MLFAESTVIGISPFETPDARLVVALCRAGALGILDLGRDASRAERDLALVARYVSGFGVRFPDGCAFPADALPDAVTTVIVSEPGRAGGFPGRSVLAQVRSVEEAEAAEAAGAAALIAVGSESGGRVEEESTFVLLQRLLAHTSLPVFAQGGIGLHTAAASMAGGAAGVVLAEQLALVREAGTPAPLRSAVTSMDGSETTLVGGHRVYTRPDLAVSSLADLSAGEVAGRLGTNLSTDLVPMGQGAAFARRLAERFRTAGGVVQAIESAITRSLDLAREHQPLRRGAPLAAEHGTEFPIVQGPMTRVSDRATFADAVAGAGALPFLALALLRGPKVEKLLQETSELLGDRPWGVGILGFVPPELREEQLEVIRRFKPPFALIAGGRPSQARPLEADGTRVYLHVPSPGLLDLYLKDGARRFVFEGRECGGHVGPRTSFALWEAQVERLLQDDDPSSLSLLFAGGIHDGRSAAMVSALTAELAARGARIGVLMGTAYLFTHEAVSGGAILGGFQAEAQRCTRTALLETAPGHATRCVETEFVRAFRAEKERLEAEGKTPQEVWAALEELNLGRLRIASKGIRREGANLVQVDEDAQHREGMYMIGQVAALRSDLVGAADLHAEVSGGAARLLGEPEATIEVDEPAPAQVAIVGMASIFPGAPDLDTFWSNIVDGVNSVTEVPAERWNTEIYYDPNGAGVKTPSKWGGFLPDVEFDPAAYGIPPRSLAAIEPVQLLSLEVAARALRDAGYEGREFSRERVSVIFGAEAGTELAGGYGFRALFPQLIGDLPPELDEVLPTLTEDSFPGVLANVIAGRIANRLDLGGSNYTVDAACASSLAAVDLGVKELVAGTSDMVLCGGADLHNSINDYLLFASVHALSPRGQCRTFDATADGITLGEGVAVVVLKRLADAERDGDRIYAVLQGVAGSSDGRSLGLTAPRKEGQMRALQRAYSRAGISPADVGLVEAHGTGTVVGDRTELATLTEVFAAAGAKPGSAAVGSVKSQIGHTKCAAGMAGLIKSALALHHRVLPPTLNVEQPNPYWKPSESPFVFNPTARPWAGPDRKAAVSAFGFGGTNFHLVLEEYDSLDQPPVGSRRWPSELLLFRGETRADAMRQVARVRETVARVPDLRLKDLARTLAGQGDGAVQVAIVARDLGDLTDKLASADDGRPDPRGVFFAEDEAVTSGQVAVLFPGQGSQRPNMLADLFVAFPELQRFLELGQRWVDQLLPPPAWTPEEKAAQKAAITDTRVAQPTLGMAGLAMADLLRRVGVQGDMMGGHSYGELVALCAAGALTEAEILELSAARGEHILAAAEGDPGTMAAASGTEDAVRAAIDGVDGVVIANVNAPSQIVISGTTAGVEAAVAQLKEHGISARPIPVACAFHSPVVAGASQTFGERLGAAAVSAPRIPVWSNTTAAPHEADPAAVRRTLADHVANPVRFVQQIEAMYAAGARIFVECGPGRVLTGLVSQILGDRPHAAIATERGRGHSVHNLLLALGQLATCGVAVDPAPLFEGRDAAMLDLDKVAPAQPAPTAWIVNGHRARPVRGELPRVALKPVTSPVVRGVGGPAAPATEGGSRDTVMVEYLQTMRTLVDQQREVMLRYLGDTAPPAVAQPAALPAAPVAEAEVVAEAAPVEAASVVETLLDIVSERTGYPTEMLGLDLDMEADLSIDSIKRIEILGELGEKLGLGGNAESDRDALIEQLASIKTLRGIVGWLEKQSADDEPGAAEPAAAPAGDDEPAVEVPPNVERFVLSVDDAPLAVATGAALTGRKVGLTDDGNGIAPALARLLEQGGADVRIVEDGEPLDGVDTVIHLGALAGNGVVHPAKRLFELTRAAVDNGVKAIVTASDWGGAFGRSANGGPLLRGGAAGLLKSVAKERPDLKVRLVDLDPSEPAADLARYVFDELLADDDLVEIGYQRGARKTLRVLQAGGDVASAPAIGKDDVVLITGGARGITARIATALAERYGCHLELVGRSPLPADTEDADLAGAEDAAALRGALLARGTLAGPREVEQAVRRVLANREIRGTLKRIQAAGSTVRYHSVDVRDQQAFGALIDGIYQKHGRLDGVIHAAGVLEDKLLVHKTPDSFDRVFDTKVAGALTLAERLKDETKFLVFFGSVAGAFGNRGQVDYAAANDALGKLALSLSHRIKGRVVCIDWGPWGGTGMVTPELEREYARRGIGLIEPDGGIDSFLGELASGRSDPQVILMRATLQSMQ